MRLGNLAAEHKADTRTAALCCKERHKKIRGIGEARPFIPDDDGNARRRLLMHHEHPAACFLRRIHGVANEIDQRLFKLVGIALDGERRPFLEKQVHAGLQLHDAMQQSVDFHRGELGGGELRQPGIGAHEPAERLGPGGDHVETSRHIVFPIVRKRIRFNQHLEAASDRLDGRQRIVQLMAQDADKALPRLQLFFPKGTGEIGDDEELMRNAALTEVAAANAPPATSAREIARNGLLGLADQILGEAKRGRIARDEALSRLREQAFPGAVHQPENLLRIESKYGDFNFFDNLSEERRRFESGLIDLMKRRKLYFEDPKGVEISERVLYRARLSIPARVPVGNYTAETFLIRNGRVIAAAHRDIRIEKLGFERFVATAAEKRSFAYGLVAVIVSLLFGWGASVLFRRS